ncbi:MULTISPECIES: Gfo/Idh/MocA family protein [unclassified Pseudofrankia]|uniref:Gfo/Idh/MocA family protein n=1 Tax=unclassified Pseudofrankia TaxID=2994372 RepID=UPI0008DAB10F|nr:MULTISPECIES: Gfo/Idh/MocA family oxidoreductase [unclassified Pseudofrankia]MDT3442580.1 Gfo/Idh/MocA family oxidoreductase [Pseudofrankia sp. BMG5.37]OHV71765.1 hypothetical protein BCD48_34250 [Pseudofrankia sp. BMG5.36]
MSPLRVGVMGCAGIALRRLLPAMSASPKVQVTAVASRDSARARDAAGRFGAEPVHGYAALLGRPDVDAVYVPLPVSLHAYWVEAALRAGKHVLAEKPLTTCQADTERLLAVARTLGRALVENVMFVHHPQHAAVARLVRDGAIGELRSFHAAFSVPRRPEGDIRYSAELGGGALWDAAVYPLRAALYFLGDELAVAGSTLTHAPWTDVDLGGAALLLTPGGVSAHLSFGLDHVYRSRYELCGSDGLIVVEPAFTPAAEHVPHIHLERSVHRETVVLTAADQVRLAVGAFAQAAARAAPPDPASLRAASLLDELRTRAQLAGNGSTTHCSALAGIPDMGHQDREPTEISKESERDAHLGTPLRGAGGPARPRP